MLPLEESWKHYVYVFIWKSLYFYHSWFGKQRIKHKSANLTHYFHVGRFNHLCSYAIMVFTSNLSWVLLAVKDPRTCELPDISSCLQLYYSVNSVFHLFHLTQYIFFSCYSIIFMIVFLTLNFQFYQE